MAAERSRSGGGQRTIVIFIPGLFRPGMDQSINATSQRLAAALEQMALPAVEFTVSPGRDREERYGIKQEFSSRVRTVVRKDAGHIKWTVDLYEFDYLPTLVGGFSKLPPLFKILAVLLVISLGAPRFCRAVLVAVARKVPGSRALEKEGLKRPGLEIALASLIGFLFGLYAVILMVGVVSVVFRPNQWVANLTAAVALIATALGLGLLSSRARDMLERVTTENAAAFFYFTVGRGRDEILDQLASLLAHVAGGARRFDSCHVISYSFGSVIAIDSLWPLGRSLLPRLDDIDTLVTIGCPLDLVQLLWPSYFHDRRGRRPQPLWVNVSAPQDVLGSRIDSSEIRIKDASGALQAAPVNLIYGVQPRRKVHLIDVLTLTGLRFHSIYWGTSPSAAGCFGEVVSTVFKDHKILRVG